MQDEGDSRNRQRGAQKGAAIGLLCGVFALLALSRFAPRFLDPPIVSILAVLIGNGGLGLVVGALAGTGWATIATFIVWTSMAGITTALWIDAIPGVGHASLGAVAGVGLGAGIATLARRGKAAITAVVALIAVVLWMVPAGVPESGVGAKRSAGPRALVVGLDGGTWRVIQPLLDRAELPTIARMIAEGTSGDLLSYDRSLSSVVWTSIATGKHPSKHGIHDFYGTSTDVTAARFWEVLTSASEPVGIFQWLVTWPPDPVPGFMVPGWLARDASTTPDRLRFIKELELAAQSRRNPGALVLVHAVVHMLREGLRFRSAVEIVQHAARGFADGELGPYRASRMIQLVVNEDVFAENYACVNPRLATVTFYGSDALSHVAWKFHEPEAFDAVTPDEVARFGETIRDYYRRFDGTLQRLLATAGPETNVFLVSDHGFRAGDRSESWLLRTEALVEALGESGTFRAHGIAARVFFIHIGDPARRAEDSARLEAKLETLTVDDQPLVRIETTTEGSSARLAFSVRPADLDRRVQTSSGIRQLRELVTDQAWSGDHEARGVIIARGPAIRRGYRIEGATIVDVAPTLLHVLGEPVGADQDGHVLREMLTMDRPIASVPSLDPMMPRRATQPNPPGESVEERLRTLGYVR